MSGLMNIMLNIRLISVIDYLRSIHRVWSKKNDTLSKFDIFQLRKYNFMQNLIFHEAATLIDKIFWEKPLYL